MGSAEAIPRETRSELEKTAGDVGSENETDLVMPIVNDSHPRIRIYPASPRRTKDRCYPYNPRNTSSHFVLCGYPYGRGVNSTRDIDVMIILVTFNVESTVMPISAEHGLRDGRTRIINVLPRS